MRKAVVLGCGLMGRVMAEDLAATGLCSVVAVDRRREAVAAVSKLSGVTALQMDVSEIDRDDSPIRDADLVVGALPGSLGHAVLRRVIQQGCPWVVDISFMPEDPADLDELARGHGCTVVVDAGVAPGLSHLLVGAFVARAREVESARIFVGGLPERRSLPFEYVTVFSPRDVLEEYTRPARVRRGGRVVALPALSEIEFVEVEGVGTLEAFLTDGLRSLLHTMAVPFMEEKTLRYPGHAERMRVLRDMGLFDREWLELPDGVLVRPIDVAVRLLERVWKPKSGDGDLTVLRVEVRGVDQDGRRRRWRAELLDRSDRSGRSSMARSTGFTATAVATWLLSSGWRRPGIVFPEELGSSREVYEYVLHYLAARGVRVRTTSSRDQELLEEN